MPASIRPIGLPLRLAALSAALLAAVCLPSLATAQTAPQLLPYTAKLLAGGGTGALPNVACGRTGAVSSGRYAYNTASDGCLATEIVLSAPRSAILDKSGAVIFADNTHYTVRRIDPVTGVVSTIAGGGAANPKSGAACSSADATLATNAFGDGCLATSVVLGSATHLALAPNGDILVGDSFYYGVRRISLATSGVAAVVLSNNGSGYGTTPPTVTFSVSPSGATAAGTAVLMGGVVTSVTITNAGSGYTTPPTITFTGTSTVPAAGTAIVVGKISNVIGNYGDSTTTSAGALSATRGFTAGAAGCSLSSTSAATGCLIGYPYGFNFDHAGDLIIADYYYNAVVALNLNTATPQQPPVVGGASVPIGTEAKVMGARTAVANVPQPCLTGTGTTTTGLSGCNYGNYTNNVTATLSMLDGPTGVAADSNNNLYVADNESTAIAMINATTGVVTNFAGTYPLLGYGTRDANTTRGLSSSTSIGSPFDVSVDLNNNVYFSDGVGGLAWRVDATTDTMFVVGGGGSPTAGSACGTTGPGKTLIATDAFGDGCPALQASFSFTPTVASAKCPGTSCYATTGLYGVFADTTGDLYLGDQGNNLIRAIVSGTQFGNTPATQTDYIDVHFAAGDTTYGPQPFAISPGGNIFTVGTPVCTLNNDANPSTANTTDCIVPITANPIAAGPYSGTLTVYSMRVPTGTSFPLSGNFVQSPATRLAVSFTTNSTCGGATFSTINQITLTATLVANGPTPTGTIQFYSNGTALGMPVAVAPLGTSPQTYGAVLPTATFPIAGPYAITATYTPATGSFFTGSTSPATGFGIAAPTFALSLIPTPLSTIKAGGQALYSFNVNATLYSGTISFACSNLPSGASCVFSPATIAGTGCSVASTVALNINTTGPVYSMPAGLGGTGSGPWSLACMIAAAILAAALGIFRRRIPARATQLLLAFAFLLGASGLVACSKSTGTLLTPGTPVGTYNTITVTATGSDGTTSSTPISLTVN